MAQPAGRLHRLVREEEAVVIRWRPYGESDKIVTLLARESGRFTGIAKGARRSRRRFPGSLEALARVRVRFRPPRHEGLAFLESASLRTSGSCAESPVRFAYACYLAELAEQFTVEGQPCEEIFELLDGALGALARHRATDAFLRSYELHLLDRAGLRPPLDACAACRQRIALGPAVVAADSGRILCSRCAELEGVRRPAFPPALLQALDRLARLPLEESVSEKLGELAAPARELTGVLLSAHLRGPLRSLDLLRQLGRGELSPYRC